MMCGEQIKFGADRMLKGGATRATVPCCLQVPRCESGKRTEAMHERKLGLYTDLYELTMAAAYFANDRREEATFELFVRELPPARKFLVTAGLEQALAFLARVGFTDDDIDFLRRQPVFKNVAPEFFDYLLDFRFTGEAWAMPEGTLAFAEEPLIRVTAPIIEAQIVETFLLSTIGFQTMIASKAARIVVAARGHDVVEFGTRRAHGFEAGIQAARAAYIGGCSGTSNVEAGRRFGIPVFGTLAHSFVMAFDSEEEAFGAFLKVFPDTATILVDTYDTLEGVELLAHRFGKSVPAVRLDSGELERLSKQARQILDSHGMTATRIFVSGDLNEGRIAHLLAAGAPIDGFGVGTELATSADAPSLGVVYKLVSAGRRGRIKLSEDKATSPHAKQVWRHFSDSDDLVSRADEEAPGTNYRPLLEQVMAHGKPTGEIPSLETARHRAAEELRRMAAVAHHPVKYSRLLEHDRKELASEIRKQRAPAR
jgi:nicotinate phosphoribosyltransferase